MAVLLSQDVQAGTLAQFLDAWKLRLRTYSQQVISGENGDLLLILHTNNCHVGVAKKSGRTPEEEAKLLAEAANFLAGTWNPAFIMIDKDQAERNACKKGTLTSIVGPLYTLKVV